MQSWRKDVINLAHDQPCKVRKTTKDKDRDHEQEEEVTLVSADGMLVLKTLLGADKDQEGDHAQGREDGAASL